MEISWIKYLGYSKTIHIFILESWPNKTGSKRGLSSFLFHLKNQASKSIDFTGFFNIVKTLTRSHSNNKASTQKVEAFFMCVVHEKVHEIIPSYSYPLLIIPFTAAWCYGLIKEGQ